MCEVIQNALQAGDFDELFFEILGWDRVEGSESIRCLGEIVTVKRLAEKRGIQVFVLETDQVKAQQRRYVKSVEENLSPLSREHILVVHDPKLKTQVWAWSYRDPDAGRWRQRLHPFFSECIPPKFIERLERLTVTLEDEDRVSLPEMARRVQDSLDDNADQRVFFRRPKYAARSHELALSLESGGIEALQEFVAFHSQLPVWFAMRYKGHSVDNEDIVQIASLGMIRAAMNFDPSRGIAFSTYAVHAMRTHCKQHIPNCLPTVYIPPYIYWPYRKFRRLRQEAISTGGPKVLREELPDLLEQVGLDADIVVSLDQFYALRPFARMTPEQRSEAVGAVTYSESLMDRDRARTPLSGLLELEQLEILREGLASLKPVDRIIICLHNGLGEEKQTLEMIARQVGLTREGVRQRELAAIKALGYRLAWYFEGPHQGKAFTPGGPAARIWD